MNLSYDQWAQDLLDLRVHFESELMDADRPESGDRYEALHVWVTLIDARLTQLEPHLTADSQVSDLIRHVRGLYLADDVPDTLSEWTEPRPPESHSDP